MSGSLYTAFPFPPVLCFDSADSLIRTDYSESGDAVLSRVLHMLLFQFLSLSASAATLPYLLPPLLPAAVSVLSSVPRFRQFPLLLSELLFLPVPADASSHSASAQVLYAYPVLPSVPDMEALPSVSEFPPQPPSAYFQVRPAAPWSAAVLLLLSPTLFPAPEAAGSTYPSALPSLMQALSLAAAVFLLSAPASGDPQADASFLPKFLSVPALQLLFLYFLHDSVHFQAIHLLSGWLLLLSLYTVPVPAAIVPIRL